MYSSGILFWFRKTKFQKNLMRIVGGDSKRRFLLRDTHNVKIYILMYWAHYYSKITFRPVFWLFITIVKNYDFKTTLIVGLITFDIKNLIIRIFQLIWFCAILPYIILSILCVKAVTLDGAWDGIKFLFTPDWERLQTSECWIDGGTQIFFSYGVGIGALLALGSYNKFHHNCYR